MNEKRIDELKQAAKSFFDMIQSSGNADNPEVQAMLMQAFEHIGQRIQELRDQGEESGPIQDAIPPQNDFQQPYQSSNVNSFSYDPDDGKLYVKFQGDYPMQNGPVYEYEGVPEVIFNIFQKGAVSAKTTGQNKWGKWWEGKNPSLGASMYELIKLGGYPYKKVA